MKKLIDIKDFIVGSVKRVELKYWTVVFRVLSLSAMLLLLVFILDLSSGIKNQNLDLTKIVDFYFLELTDADSTIIKYQNKTILIDTGLETDALLIDKKLENLNISTIDYLILTHPDKDHIGSSVHLINKYAVSEIYQAAFEKGSDLEQSLKTAISSKGIKNNVVNVVTDLYIGDLEIKLIPGIYESYNKDNDYSIVTLITYYNHKFFMAADIEEARINEILKFKIGEVDVLKIPHHGRYNPSSLNFLNSMNPKYAIVTSKSADKKIVDMLHKLNTAAYYTPDGMINIKSDGNGMNVTRGNVYE